MNIDQIALEAMSEVCSMGEQYPNDQSAQRKARIQITIRAAIEKALVGNKSLLEDALEREQSLIKLLDKMNSQVTECVFHGHNVELCLQHSGQAPCMSEDEMALEAHIERIKELLEGVIESDLTIAPEWDVEVSEWLCSSPESSLAQRDLLTQADALERLKNVADVEYETTGVAVDIASIFEIADALRQEAKVLRGEV